MQQSELIKAAEDRVKPIFARHETFHLRFGWLKKGYDKSDVFSVNKAGARAVLGVGNNMVRAIKYWCQAFKIFDSHWGGRGITHKTSQFGSKLLHDTGWDPYLEDMSTLWLLHWNLLKPPCHIPAWYFAFNEFNLLSFTSEDFLFALKGYVRRVFASKSIPDSSLIKDVNCLLRTYVEKTTSRVLKEDSIDCPFTQLGLITAYGDSKRYAFNFGNKPTLSHEIVVFACLEFSSLAEKSAKTMSISRLLYDPGSPGQVFKLTESSLCESIDHVSNSLEEVALTDTAGIIQFTYDGDPELLADELLERHYSKRK